MTAQSGVEIIEGRNERELSVPGPAQPTAVVTLFGTDDPEIVVQRATTAAKALIRVVESQHMFVNISGKRFLLVESWQLLGSMTGVFGSTEWTRPVMDGSRRVGWEARVIARTMNGTVVGGAEAMCLRDELRWADADEHALRSMAQTRALSKALSMPLRFIAQLAGFAGTPAEEMPANPSAGAKQDGTTRQGAECPACRADGFTDRRGKAATFITAKAGPRTGKLQCNGVVDGRWLNHLPPEDEPATVSADSSDEIPY